MMGGAVLGGGDPLPDQAWADAMDSFSPEGAGEDEPAWQDPQEDLDADADQPSYSSTLPATGRYT